MWDSETVKPPFLISEIDLAQPLFPISIPADHGGAHLLVRLHGRPVTRLWLTRDEDGALVSPEQLKRKLANSLSDAAAQCLFRPVLPISLPVPTLTIAICTRNRTGLLARCLDTLLPLVRDLASVQILVVDNAPTDQATHNMVRALEAVRYVLEPVPGLNIARNRALTETNTEYLGFVDDDAVVDPGWLTSLAEGVAHSPEAGAFTGPILPLVLDTEARLRFELAGGFGKGFSWRRFGPQHWGSSIHPANAGDFGTGATMVFSTVALRALGGFDDALDTGPPLAGGGDLDIFYRLLRSGRPLVYLPGLLVHHEHRADMKGLARQYYSWGLSIAALMQKNEHSDPTMRRAHRAMLRGWLKSKLRELARSGLGRGPRPPGLILAELHGALVGYFGEYQRSQLRVAERKMRHLS